MAGGGRVRVRLAAGGGGAPLWPLGDGRAAGVPAEVRLPWQRFMPLYGWAWNLFQVGWWMGWWVGRSQICFIIDGLVDWDD